MHPIEPSATYKDDCQRLAARLAASWDEHLQLTEKLASIEASAAWAVACRLTELRRRLAPNGTRRHHCLHLSARALRLWRREGLLALLRRVAGKIVRRRPKSPLPEESKGEQARERVPRQFPQALQGSDFIMSAPASCEFRVAFIGPSAACEAQSLRYRAQNVIEALALAGLQGAFFPLEEAQANLTAIMSHDLIVCVRLMHNPIVSMLIDSARRRGLPIVFDIDDYLFDPWVMPYIEGFRGMPRSQALQILDEFGTSLRACDFFTGSTSYLAEKAAAYGKPSFVLPNALNGEQLQLARQALAQRDADPRDQLVRIGYFSGTRTHQADFRVVYPVLMALLGEQRSVRLRIVGTLDLGEFPGLARFGSQIEILPLFHWRDLPAKMADIDINLLPLELTPFNEGKSNLKYFEAGLLRVPSIASPTRINRENITHGFNGLLAQTVEEWYNGLTLLVADAGRRQQMGQMALEHVLRNYSPAATATKAVTVYRQILHRHRHQGKRSVDRSVAA